MTDLWGGKPDLSREKKRLTKSDEYPFPFIGGRGTLTLPVKVNGRETTLMDVHNAQQVFHSEGLQGLERKLIKEFVLGEYDSLGGK